MLLQHNVIRPHPETGAMTPLWTARRVIEMAGMDRTIARGLLNVLPPSEYGDLKGSPLWSLRQAVLVGGWLKWVRIWERDGDKFAEAQMKARIGRLWKEWTDGNRKRLGNGNHRNAVWSARKLFGNG